MAEPDDSGVVDALLALSDLRTAMEAIKLRLPLMPASV